jgi:hypothetical protein
MAKMDTPNGSQNQRKHDCEHGGGDSENVSGGGAKRENVSGGGADDSGDGGIRAEAAHAGKMNHDDASGVWPRWRVRRLPVPSEESKHCK